MATTVRSIVLWRKEIANQPGALASTLELFASADADLQIVMGYRYRVIRQRQRSNFLRSQGKSWLPPWRQRDSRPLESLPFWWNVITGRGIGLHNENRLGNLLDHRRLRTEPALGVVRPFLSPLRDRRKPWTTCRERLLWKV